MKPVTAICVFLATATFAATLANAQSLSPASASQVPSVAGAQKLDAVRAVIVLRGELTSSSTKPGKEIKATLAQGVTLPSGVTLPKGTFIYGSVASVSKHRKEKPNGVLVLEFNKAVPKDGNPVPLVVRIQKLASSVENENAKVILPNSNAHMVASTANSGGLLQLNAQDNDHTSLRSNYAETSLISGVYVSPTKDGSGPVFSIGEDVYLDADVQITVLLASIPEKTP